MMQRQQKIVKKNRTKNLANVADKENGTHIQKDKAKTKVWILVNFWGTK